MREGGGGRGWRWGAAGSRAAESSRARAGQSGMVGAGATGAGAGAGTARASGGRWPFKFGILVSWWVVEGVRTGAGAGRLGRGVGLLERRGETRGSRFRRRRAWAALVAGGDLLVGGHVVHLVLGHVVARRLVAPARACCEFLGLVHSTVEILRPSSWLVCVACAVHLLHLAVRRGEPIRRAPTCPSNRSRRARLRGGGGGACGTLLTNA